MRKPIHIRLCLAILLCGFLFGFMTKCLAQTPHVYSFSELTGFEPKTIHNLTEDSKGNIWISTDQELYKYNGTDFIAYTHPYYSSEVGQLYEDRDGRLWCNNFTGQVFYIEKDSLKLFMDVGKYVKDYANITTVDFPSIYATTYPFGYLEMDFYSKKLRTRKYRVDKTSSSYHIAEHGDTLFYERIRVYKLFPHKLHLYRPPYLLEVNTKTQDTSVLATLKPDWDLRSRETIYKKGEKLLIAMTGSSKGLLLEYGEEGLKKMPAPYDLTGSFHSDAVLVEEDETLWLPTLDGLVVLDNQYKSVYGTHKILPGKAVTQVIKDREGNYWIATKDHGIFIMPSIDVLCWNAENSALLTDEIKAVEQDNKGNIYLGQVDRNLFELLAGDRKPQYLATMSNACENMCYDSHRNRIYWSPTKAYYDLSRKQLAAFPQNISGLSKDFSFIDAVSVVASHSGSAYIINFSKPGRKYPPMDLLRRNNNFDYRIFHYETENLDYSFYQIILRGRRSMDNEYDSVNNSIWVSYVDGLYRYKNMKEKEILWQGKSIVSITLLADIKGGGVWLSTHQNQLLKVEDSGNVILKKDSLPARVIEIRQWKQYLFLASKRGIYKFNTENNDLELFNHLDGLPSNDINDLEIVNDTVYAATMKGLAMFPAGLSSINTLPPEIAISGVSVNEKAVPLQEKYDPLFKGDNLNISFRARAIRSQGTFQYQYRMLGLDSTWISAESHVDFTRYPSLPSGDYTFEVRAINEDGIASLQPARLELFITTPYYQTWWFFTLLVAVAPLIFIFVLRLQAVRKESRIQKIEKELVESKLSALRSQMNPHFIFNALNSIQSYIMSRDKVLASAYLSRFSELMRLYLNHSNTDTLKLSEEINALERYLELEKIRFEDDLIYTIDLDEELIPEDISIPSMLIQPFVENAFKHGLLHKKGAKKLAITFTGKVPNQLQCSIEDNGIGRERSAEINRHKRKIHKSFATPAIENRLKLLNQGGVQKIEANTIDLYDKNGQASGTLVELCITF